MATSALQRYLEFWLPSSGHHMRSGGLERSRLLIIVTSIVMALIFAFCPIYYYFECPEALCITFVSGIGLFVPLAILKFTGRFHSAGVLALLIMEAMLTLCVFISGGIHSPILWYHCITPLAGAILISNRTGVYLGIYSIALFWGLDLANAFNIEITNLFSAELKKAQESYAYFAIILTCVVFIYLFRRMTDNFYAYVEGIFRYISDLLLVCDEGGQIKIANQQAINLLGFTEQELLGTNVKSLIDNAAFNPKNLEYLVEAGELKETECFLINKTNQKIPVALSGNVLRNGSGQVYGLILSAKDTRESRVIQELKQTQSQLVQSGKLAALGQLSSGMAHELNNPLFIIKGFNGRIRSTFEGRDSVRFDEVKEYVRMVDENCDRMKKIITHFREFSRQSNRRFGPVKINEVIYKSFILMNEQLRLRNIQVTKKFAKEDPFVLADDTRLEQILVNLISNSRDAIEAAHSEKGGQISVQSRVLGKVVIVEFSDNGCGMPAAIMERIFEPFFTTKEVGKGTGLGLSITHGLVRELGGQIQCDSRSGQGTTFRIALPLLSDEDAKKQEALHAS